MGLFDVFKGKNVVESCEMNQQLFKDITQDVAIFMFKAGITSSPALSFFYNDQGLFERFFCQRISDSGVQALKRQSVETYLFILGAHAFGLGVYATGLQSDYAHSISDFSSSEMRRLEQDCYNNDAYELALNQLNVPVNSRNKQILDHIILTGIKALQANMGSEASKPQNIKAYMQVLYNAGITMYMR